jgi:hypothetical protein
MADSDIYDGLSSLSNSDSDDDFSMADPESDEEMPKRRKGKRTGAYIITDALQAPRATTYTAQSLFDQIVAGDIDLDPEYQRGAYLSLRLVFPCSDAYGRGCMAGSKANRPYRLHFPQFLHPTSHFR